MSVYSDAQAAGETAAGQFVDDAIAAAVSSAVASATTPLQAQLAAANASLAQANADLAAAQTDDQSQIATVTQLRGQVDTLNQQVAALEAQLAAAQSDPPPPPASALGFGTYLGQFQAAAVVSTVGKRPDFSTYYYQVDATTAKPAALNAASHKAEIDQGISQVIDLDYKQAKTLTMAQVAQGNADAALTTWLKDLKTISDYAVSKGAQVWFSFVHEAVVHINQAKFSTATQPTQTQMATAWDHVMGLVEIQAPNAVRTYWFGGMEAKVNGVAGGVAFGDQLDATLIQAVTFDPYRFASHSHTETATQTFGAVVTALLAKPWAHGKPWGLTEYGTDVVHGDANNATWITQAVQLLRQQGATIGVYFDRQPDSTENYIITAGSTPLSLAAYKTALTG